MSTATTPHPSTNPRRIAAGMTAARARWGPPRILHISDLHPNVRELVAALVDVSREQVARQEAGRADAWREPPPARSPEDG